MRKIITKRIHKQCAICSRIMHVKIYADNSYRGGHYFGKIPLYTNKALQEAEKAGTRQWRVGEKIFQVMKRGPIPYKHIEYWECPNCYWRG